MGNLPSFFPPPTVIDADNPNHPALCSHTIPFGQWTGEKIVDELSLRTVWPMLNEQALTEKEEYTDLDPMAAPKWYVSVEFNKPKKPHRMKTLMNRLIEAVEGTNASSPTSALHMRGKETGAEGRKGAMGALDSLTKNYAASHLAFVSTVASAVGCSNVLFG